MTILESTDRAFAKALRKITTRSRSQAATVEKSVRAILQAVEKGGDRAVVRYAKKFDRISLTLDQIPLGDTGGNQGRLLPHSER
ncbi:MAG: histidinol dehydrogenase [Nitrospira sp.]